MEINIPLIPGILIDIHAKIPLLFQFSLSNYL